MSVVVVIEDERSIRIGSPPVGKPMASGFGVRTGVVPPKGAMRAAEVVEQQISATKPCSVTGLR